MKKLSIIITILVLILTCSACSNNEKVEEAKQNTLDVKEIFEYVFDAGTLTSLDYEFANEYMASVNDNYGGGCTAIAKVNSNGDTLVGRNLDLNISNKPAYFFKTDVEGLYKTINLTYTFRDISPDYELVKDGVLEGDFIKIMPFMADDVLNEKGLYIEVNMRNAESWPTGEPKFSCPGTNPDSKERVYISELTRYIGDHCATVDEALEYVKTLNLYTQDGYWNFCFLIADATGHYGVLEIANNEIIWNDYAPAQTNFYLNEKFSSIQEYGTGQGRYKTVIEGIKDVETEEEMFTLIDKTSYFQFYDFENCEYDYRYELVAITPELTSSFVENEKNRELIEGIITEYSKPIKSMTRQQLQDANEYWESTFTEVINCNNKTIFVRFFEDDSKTMMLSLD